MEEAVDDGDVSLPVGDDTFRTAELSEFNHRCGVCKRVIKAGDLHWCQRGYGYPIRAHRGCDMEAVIDERLRRYEAKEHEQYLEKFGLDVSNALSHAAVLLRAALEHAADEGEEIFIVDDALNELREVLKSFPARSLPTTS